MKQRVNVLEGDIKKHMLNMALPSMGGSLAITLFNLTDTFFVSKLGTDALAAMGFTFPVVMVIGSATVGISLGAGSVLARAVGRGDHHMMHRIATDGILLAMLVGILIGFLGYHNVDAIFRLLGAEGEALALVDDYMSIWFACIAVVIIPPISDSCMRAMGDMIRPLAVMLTVAFLNVILDPILIFGLFGLPAMGIKGAIIATVISRALGGGLSLAFVAFHYKLFDLKYENFRELLKSWNEIVRIGVPAIFVRLLPQAIRVSMTRLAATTVGVYAVAAIAAGQRLESFATIASMGVGSAIVPIIGQNFGAGKHDRVMTARSLLIRLSWLYGIGIFLLTIPFGPFLAKIFTQVPEVIGMTTTYIRIVIIGTIGLNQYNWCSEAFNAVGKPRYAILINFIGTFIIILPFVLLGCYFAGFNGMLIGLVAGQLIVGTMAVWMSAKWLT